MSASFVPLVPGAASQANLGSPTRLKPIAPQTPSSFQPTIPTKTDPAPAPASHIPHGPPKVTLEKLGEVITHIRIECSCGQVTELKCDY